MSIRPLSTVRRRGSKTFDSIVAFASVENYPEDDIELLGKMIDRRLIDWLIVVLWLIIINYYVINMHTTVYELPRAWYRAVR